jgi:GTP-binding protein
VKKPLSDKGYQAPPSSYLISAFRAAQFPPADRPEVAFAGRSNVGKSSLLNRLLNRRKLARTSNTPGRTQSINFFEIGTAMYFVDLPGFGYAKVPMAVRAAWQPMVDGYISAPRDLRLVLVLVDIRRDPGDEEKGLLAWLESKDIPYLVVATKFDKLSRGKGNQRLAVIRKNLDLSDLPLPFSSLTGEGREEIWAHLRLACGLDVPPEVPDDVS